MLSALTLATALLASVTGGMAGEFEVALIDERWFTDRMEPENVDSVAVWHGPDGQHWLLATAKEGHRLHVYDAANGATLRMIGGPGSEPGRFMRPNGISVIDDLVWVVERDNRRVSVLRLPEFTPLGSFGDEVLIKPYGLWVQPLKDGDYQVYVTDNYETADEQVPPNAELGERVRQWRVKVSDRGLQTERGRPFGATEGPGVLRIVESIHGDATHDRLLLIEEDESTMPGGRVYDLGGIFTGQLAAIGLFDGQPEGVALYDCPDGSGYWVLTDQGDTVNRFHVLERRTLAHVGSFAGRYTRNTDGVWLSKKSIPRFPVGAFYAVHDDGNVAAFSWSDVIRALELQPVCPPPTVEAEDVEALLERERQTP